MFLSILFKWGYLSLSSAIFCNKIETKSLISFFSFVVFLCFFVWFVFFYFVFFLQGRCVKKMKTWRNETPSVVMDSSRSVIFIFNSWALAILSCPWQAFSASLMASRRKASSLCRKSSRICSNSVVICSCNAHNWL